MSFEDYLISILLIGLVVRQIRGKKLTLIGLLWPVALVITFGFEYIRAVPNSGNNLLFVVFLAILGGILGVSCALLTKIHYSKKHAKLIGKATALAAVLWISGIGSRLVFGIFATHGGGESIVRLSDSWHITDPNVWATAFLMMSLCEVLGRTITLAIRAFRIDKDFWRASDNSVKISV